MLARQIAIGFGLAIIFPLLVYYGVRTFSPPPKWPPFEYEAQAATAEERRAQNEKRKVERATYNDQAKAFARVLVIASTPLGICAILIGTFLGSASVGTGLILGGILTVAHGYWGYWSYADDWLRFVSLLLGFGVLLFVAYWRWPSGQPNLPQSPP